MTSTERAGILIVAALTGALAGSIATGFAGHLNEIGWFSGAANEIQWSSGVATFASVAAGITLYLNRTCAVSWRCFRFGEHPVAGTLRKVCAHHHTLAHHERVHDLHSGAHATSGRLGRGETHGR